MSSGTHGGSVSKAASITGWVIGLLPALLMCFGAVWMLMNPKEAAKGSAQFGYPDRVMTIMVFVELACVLLYLIPRTAVLGAVLLTGYLGGATATHVRINDPMFVVPVLMGAIFWLGLYLRDRRVRALLPFRR